MESAVSKWPTVSLMQMSTYDKVYHDSSEEYIATILEPARDISVKDGVVKLDSDDK